MGGYPNTIAGLAAGLVHGTLIATGLGWRPAEAIAPGDLVLTFDHGLQPVLAVTRGTLWPAADRCPRGLWPLAVPAGALGNDEAVLVVPEQSVLIESDAADEALGDPFVLVTAADLAGYRGIERVPPAHMVEVVQLHFAHDQVIHSDNGVLYHCPPKGLVEVENLLSGRGGGKIGYPALPRRMAAALIASLQEADARAARVVAGSPAGMRQGQAA